MKLDAYQSSSKIVIMTIPAFCLGVQFGIIRPNPYYRLKNINKDNLKMVIGGIINKDYLKMVIGGMTITALYIMYKFPLINIADNWCSYCHSYHKY
jgi:hypothetical protein